MSSKPHLTEVTRAAEDHQPSRPPARGILAELSERKVCRTAVSYILIMWLNLQIGDVIFPMIGLPDWSLSLIIVIGVMGFPVVVILAWAFQVTPEGIVLDEGSELETQTDRRLDTLVSLSLLISSVVLSVLLLLQFLADERAPLLTIAAPEEPRGMLISSLSFESATPERASETIAMGIHRELRHRLINLEGIDVLPEASNLDPADDRRRLSLTGSLLVDGSIGHVLAHVIDLSAGRYLMSTTFDLKVNSALTAEIAAAERIVGEVRRKLLGEQTRVAKAPRMGPNPAADG